MGKINFANIQSALGKAKEAAAPLQNKGHTENVPVDFICLADRNIYNESDNDESIKELADNIEACGLLHPITVNKIGTEKYQIISGERRFRAITEYLQWKSVPCMVFEGLSAEAAQLKLCMANLAVREYTTSQKYKFYLEVKALLEKMKASGEYKGGLQKGIAEILNVTKRQVAKYSAIEKLPSDIQQQVMDGTISINKALDMAASTHSESESKNDSYMVLLSDVLSRLSETNRNRILSGEVDLETLLSLSKNDDPVHRFKPYDEKTHPENEDTASKKDEPVHHFESDDEKTPSKNEDMTSKKDEPVHHFESDDEKTPSKNEDMTSKKDEPAHHFESDDEKTPQKNEDTESKKDEPVHHFESDDEKTPPKNEDTESEKDEPVHIFESDDEKTPSKNEDMTSEKDEPVHHFESDDEKTPPKNEDTASKKDEPVHHLGTRVQTQPSTSNSKKQQECSVLIFKDGTFVPNKIQVLEEYESYTVFKVFAVRQ